MPAPERLQADSTTLRRFSVADSATLARVVGESLEHLRPFLPFASETASASEPFQRARLSGLVQLYDHDETSWEYAICDASDAVIGCAGIVVRDDGRNEIGYWVHPHFVRQGHAATAARLLTEAWRTERRTPRLEIWCDEANVASAAIPRRLGYRLETIRDVEPQAPGETGRMMIWVLDREAGKSDPQRGA